MLERETAAQEHRRDGPLAREEIIGELAIAESGFGLVALIELRDQERLAEVIRGTDVRGILGGHLHYSTTSTFAGVPVSVASATCYTQDLAVAYPGARGQDGGQSYNLVHVYGDRVLHSVVPIGQFPTVYEMTPEMLEAFIAGTEVR